MPSTPNEFLCFTDTLNILGSKTVTKHPITLVNKYWATNLITGCYYRSDDQLEAEHLLATIPHGAACLRRTDGKFDVCGILDITVTMNLMAS